MNMSFSAKSAPAISYEHNIPLKAQYLIVLCEMTLGGTLTRQEQMVLENAAVHTP